MSSVGDTTGDGSPPPYYYIAFIDEAGDPGIERVRPIDNPGGTEWLVMGATLIEVSKEPEPVRWVRSILDTINARQRQELHYRELHEWQKPIACRELAKLPVRLFALCSNKKNMRQYTNERAARKTNPLAAKQVLYNFCLRLIIERISDFVLRHSLWKYGEPRYVKFFFSKRGGHNYAHLSSYNELLKNQARSSTTLLKRREIKWQVVDRRLQEPIVHTLCAGVQLADIVASAFYQAVDVLPPTEWNCLNAKLFRDRIATESGYCHDYGVVFQPSPTMTHANLLPRQKDIFEFYGFDRRDFDVPWLGNKAAGPGLNARHQSS